MSDMERVPNPLTNPRLGSVKTADLQKMRNKAQTVVERQSIALELALRSGYGKPE